MAQLALILVRPGMKVRPVHFQMVTARPDGQHFPAMEAPADLAADLRAFFGPLE